MIPDMAKVKPQWMASVPRIWEGVRASILRNVNKEGGVKRGIFKFFLGVGAAHAYLFNMFKGRLPAFNRRIRWIDKSTKHNSRLYLVTPVKAAGKVLGGFSKGFQGAKTRREIP